MERKNDDRYPSVILVLADMMFMTMKILPKAKHHIKNVVETLDGIARVRDTNDIIQKVS